MPSDIEEIREVLAELLAERRKPKKRRDPRPNVNFRMNDDEIALLDAACLDRGLCRSDLIRLGLNTLLGTAMPIRRDAGIAGHRFHARHKPDHFSDQKTSVVERNQASAREAAARQAVRLGLEAKRLMVDADAAMHARIPVEQGMIGDSRSAPLSGKLSR